MTDDRMGTASIGIEMYAVGLGTDLDRINGWLVACWDWVTTDKHVRAVEILATCVRRFMVFYHEQELLA